MRDSGCGIRDARFPGWRGWNGNMLHPLFFLRVWPGPEFVRLLSQVFTSPALVNHHMIKPGVLPLHANPHTATHWLSWTPRNHLLFGDFVESNHRPQHAPNFVCFCAVCDVAHSVIGQSVEAPAHGRHGRRASCVGTESGTGTGYGFRPIESRMRRASPMLSEPPVNAVQHLRSSTRLAILS